jgi:aryl-alcohol dehydrogenase (NADP+)
VLTGKYAPDAAPDPDTRAGRADRRMMQTEWRPDSLRIARILAGHAQASGRTATQFALGWVLANSLVTGLVAGPRTLDQWRDYLTALDAPFTAQDEALVDSLVAPGHPSTPGYTDPVYPVEGRGARLSPV